MSSIKCPNCNLTNWVTEASCKRCRYVFHPSPVKTVIPESYVSASEQLPVEVGSSTYPSNRVQPVHHYFPPSVNLKTGLAVASMVLGIVSLPTSLFLIGLVLAPIGLILGILALTKASKKPNIYGGKGFAIAGITTSSVALIFVVPLIAAIAIPNLLAARRAANEGSAISSLRTLHGAQQTYMAIHDTEVCGDLTTLGSAKLIDSVLATGEKAGYRYEVTVSSERIGCDLFATPISKSTGTRSFMISHDGVSRGADKKGLMADKNDPRLGQ